MNTKAIALLVCATLGIVPFIASAQVFVFPDQPRPNQPLSFSGAIDRIFLNFIWPVVIFISILAFIYAGVLFVTSSGNESKISQAKKAFIWGIVGTAVIIISFSLIFVVRGILNL